MAKVPSASKSSVSSIMAMKAARRAAASGCLAIVSTARLPRSVMYCLAVSGATAPAKAGVWAPSASHPIAASTAARSMFRMIVNPVLPKKWPSGAVEPP
jgi:hypothetical protein